MLMDSNLRKIISVVNSLVVLVLNNPQEIKNDLNNLNNCIKDIQQQQYKLKSFMDDTSKKLQYWCNKYTDVYFLDTRNILSKTIKFIYFFIINYKLNKLSDYLYFAGILEKNLYIIYNRCIQFKTLLHHEV